MPSGPKKRRAARRIRKGGTGDSQFDEDDHMESTLTKVEDGLAVRTTDSDVKLAKADDDNSSKGIVLGQNLGSKGGLESISTRKEVAEHVLDSRLEDHKDKPANENVKIESTLIKVAERVDLETNSAAAGVDEKMSLTDDVVSSREAFLVKDVGFKDVLELGQTESDGKEVADDVLDSSLGEGNDGKQPQEEVLDSRLVLEDPEKRTAALNKASVSSHNETDSQGEENVFIEDTSVKDEDALDVKTAVVDIQSEDPMDDPSIKRVILVQDVVPRDIFELGLKESDEKEMHEDILESILEKDEPKELPAEVYDSGPIENDEELVQGISLIEPSYTKLENGLTNTVTVDVEWADAAEALSEGDVVVQNVAIEDGFEVGSKGNDGKEVLLDVLNFNPDEDKEKELPPDDVNNSSLKENEDNLVEKNALIEANLPKLEDGLAVTPADVNSGKPDGNLQDIGSEDHFQLDLEKDEGKEVEDVLDSSLGRVEEKVPHSEVNDSGPNENGEKIGDKSSIFDSLIIMEANRLAMRTIAAADLEVAETDNVLSSIGIVLGQGEDFEDVLDLGIRKNDQKDVTDVFGSELSPVLRGRKKKRAAKKKTSVSSHTETDSQVEENAFTEPTTSKMEDGLIVKNVAAPDELGEPPGEVKGSGLKENEEYPVREVSVIKPSHVKLEDNLATATAADNELPEPDDTVSKGVVLAQDVEFEDGFEVSSKGNDGKEIIHEVLDLAELDDPISTKQGVLTRDLGLEDITELGWGKNEGRDANDNVINLSLEEDDRKETSAEDFGLGSALKVEENASLKPTSIEVEDGLVGKTAAADVELGEPIDSVSTKGVTLVQDAGPEDVFELGLSKTDGKEDFLDSSLEDEWKDPRVKVDGVGPKGDEDKPGADGSVKRTAASVELAEPVDTLSDWVVVVDTVGSEDGFEVDSKGDDEKEVVQNVLDLRQEEDEGKEPPYEANESGPKDNDNSLVEENVLIGADSTKLADDAMLDEPSSRGVPLNQNIGSEYVSQFGFEEINEKEDIEGVLDSSHKKVEIKEPLMEVNDLNPKANHEKVVEEDALTDPTTSELEDNSAVMATTDVELAQPTDAVSSEDISELDLKEKEGIDVMQDAVSSRGIVLHQDASSEDVLELGPKEKELKDVNEDALSSDQPPMNVVNSDPVLKGPKKRRAAKKKSNVSSQNETNSEGPRKKKSAKQKIIVSSQNETDSQGPKGNYDNQIEENVLINSNELEDGLGVRTAAADVESGTPVDEASSKGVSQVQDKGNEDIFQLGLKENDGKEVIEEVSDTSLEKIEGKEQPVEVIDRDPVEEADISDLTSIKPEDDLAVRTAADDGLAEQVDVVSSKGVVHVRDIGYEDILEFGSKKNEGKGVIEDIIDSTTKEDEEKETPAEVHAPGSLLKGENALKKYHSMDDDEVRVVQVADDVALYKGVVDDVGSEDDLEMDLKKNRGRNLLNSNELIEEVCDPSLKESEGKDPTGEVYGLGSKEQDDKQVTEDPVTNLVEELDLTSPVGEALNVIELGTKRTDEKELLEGNELTEKHLDSGPKQKSTEPAAEVICSGPNENDGKPVVEDPLTDELELASNSKKTEGKELSSIVDGDSMDSALMANEKDMFEGEEPAEKLLDSGPEEIATEPAADVLYSYPKESDGKPLLDNLSTDELVMVSNSKDTEGKELLGADKPAKEVLDWGPTDNVDKPEVEDILASELEFGSDNDVTEGKDLDSALGSFKLDSVSLTRDAVHNVFELGSINSDDEDLLEKNNPSEEVLHKSAVEDPKNEELEMESESNETGAEQLASKEILLNPSIEEPVGIHDLGAKVNDDKRAVEGLQADEFNLTSKEVERKESGSVVASDDSSLPKTVVGNALLEGKSAKKELGIDGEDLIALIKGVRKTIEEQLLVVEDMKVDLQQMLDKVNLIRAAVQS